MKRTSAIAAVTAAALALSLAACGSADSAAASSAPAESTAASTEAASSAGDCFVAETDGFAVSDLFHAFEETTGYFLCRCLHSV